MWTYVLQSHDGKRQEKAVLEASVQDRLLPCEIPPPSNSGGPKPERAPRRPQTDAGIYGSSGGGGRGVASRWSGTPLSPRSMRWSERSNTCLAFHTRRISQPEAMRSRVSQGLAKRQVSGRQTRGGRWLSPIRRSLGGGDTQTACLGEIKYIENEACTARGGSIPASGVA